MMVSGCFSYYGPLIKLTINIKQNVYFSIFGDQLLPFIQGFLDEYAMGTSIL